MTLLPCHPSDRSFFVFLQCFCSTIRNPLCSWVVMNKKCLNPHRLTLLLHCFCSPSENRLHLTPLMMMVEPGVVDTSHWQRRDTETGWQEGILVRDLVRGRSPSSAPGISVLGGKILFSPHETLQIQMSEKDLQSMFPQDQLHVWDRNILWSRIE